MRAPLIDRRHRRSALGASALLLLLALSAACLTKTRQDGETCVKDTDCVSGYCSSLICAVPPPTFNDAGGTITPSQDASSASSDGSSGGGDATMDTGSTGTDSGSSSDDAASPSDAAASG